MQRASIQYWRSDEVGPVARAEQAEAKVAELIVERDRLYAALLEQDSLHPLVCGENYRARTDRGENA